MARPRARASSAGSGKSADRAYVPIPCACRLGCHGEQSASEVTERVLSSQLALGV
jgi:hypothetical protein